MSITARAQTIAVLLAVAGSLAPQMARAADWAVVLAYHRFGNERLPSTNIRLDQFEAQLALLKSGGYTVLPVSEIVAAIRDGQSLPDRTVGITIDDAYRSAYEEAWPRLREAGFPFTLFVATEAVDARAATAMSWDQIREMRDAGVEIGGHSRAHQHMPAQSAALNAEDLLAANARLEEELGEVPRLFAYPFGEADADSVALVRELGFTVAFGQHSGVVHASADAFYLPRFPLNERFGGIDRFKLVSSALPIPVADLTPTNPTLTADANPPAFGFTVSEPIDNLDRLACFASGRGRVRVERLDMRFEVRLDTPFPPGRSRINCTIPAGNGRWRWLGTQFYVAAE